MPRLIWSPSALQDIRCLYRFLVEKNPEAARQAIKAIRGSVQAIAEQPRMGRPVEGLDVEYREWPIDFGDSGYIALYRHEGRTVMIVAVRHQREIGY